MCSCPLLSSNDIPLFSTTLHLGNFYRWTQNWTRWYDLRRMPTVRKTPTGWQAIVRRKGHATTSKVFPKKYLAERWASQQDEMIHAMAVTPNASRTALTSILARYLDTISPRKRSHAKERSRIGILDRHLGHYTLADLGPQQIMGFVDARLESIGSDAVRKELATLSVVIDAAMALWGVDLKANPVHTAKGVLRVTKTLKPGVQRDRRPTAVEIAVLYGSHLGMLVEYAVETGMRRGEIAAQRAEHRQGNLLWIPETKTDKARTIPMSERAMEILGSLPMRDDGLAWGLRPDSISQAFARICAENNIADLRFHDLRHEAASRFFERGLSIEEVASITGHEDWKSLKRYTHIDITRLAAKIDKSSRDS